MVVLGQIVQGTEVLGKSGHGRLWQVRQRRHGDGAVGLARRAVLTHETPCGTFLGRLRRAASGLPLATEDADCASRAGRNYRVSACEDTHKSRSCSLMTRLHPPPVPDKINATVTINVAPRLLLNYDFSDQSRARRVAHVT
ncbi:hypothetical protein Sar04_07480 [Salinispora arenicola]|uniref:Uncharacterized protein n=1 Tax=Salinispora arenicola TaxID=168697 RepID=A0ABQ4JM20_SALAC|nr:hypothetical protein Sar04_07480 [Salinispora arenicola]